MFGNAARKYTSADCWIELRDFMSIARLDDMGTCLMVDFYALAAGKQGQT